jgi:hypothetical protein
MDDNAASTPVIGVKSKANAPPEFRTASHDRSTSQTLNT